MHTLMAVARAIVYVDGFNFYYGAVKDTPHRWLDLESFCDDLLRRHQVVGIKYFTARVNDRPDDPSQSQRQDVYLRALDSMPRVDCFFGQFRTNRKKVQLAKALPDGTQRLAAMITEEKGSDVNLGAHLVWDSCHRAQAGQDVACVISNDSDLQTPVDMARRLGISVITVNPHLHNEQPNSLFGDDVRRLKLSHLRNNQLPDPLTLSDGNHLHRPSAWA